MIEKEQWVPNNSPNLNAMEICLQNNVQSFFETLQSKPKIVSELKVTLEKIRDSFSACPNNKAVLRFRN